MEVYFTKLKQRWHCSRTIPLKEYKEQNLFRTKQVYILLIDKFNSLQIIFPFTAICNNFLFSYMIFFNKKNNNIELTLVPKNNRINRLMLMSPWSVLELLNYEGVTVIVTLITSMRHLDRKYNISVVSKFCHFLKSYHSANRF